MVRQRRIRRGRRVPAAAVPTGRRSGLRRGIRVLTDGAEAGAESKAGITRFRLDIAYDGTEFAGWARQPGLRTVCGVLTDALETLTREPVALTVAGRTDAGVHASGQVAHVDLGVDVHRDEIVRRLARLLPADVRVKAARAVSDDFDARFSALRRHYVYRLATAVYGAEPLRARDTVSWPYPVDLAAMNDSAARLLGEHDFAAFCRSREGATTVRELQRFAWLALPDGLVVAEVTADAFCHSMVRSLVGALLDVGRSRRAVEWPAALLDAGDGQREAEPDQTRPSARTGRAGEVQVAPAHGLTLTGVDYPPDDLLAARAERTRRRRTAER